MFFSEKINKIKDTGMIDDVWSFEKKVGIFYKG